MFVLSVSPFGLSTFTTAAMALAMAITKAPESGPQTTKRTSAMAGLVARFLPVIEAFFVANARDSKGAEVIVFASVLLVSLCVRVCLCACVHGKGYSTVWA